jgi:hypothetical protein
VSEREPSYRFGPHPHAGVFLGLRAGQLVGFLLAGAVGLALLRSGGVLGLFAAAGVLALSAAVVMVPVGGHTAGEWAPLLVRFLLRRAAGRARFRAAHPQAGHLLGVPAGGLDPQPPEPGRSMPGELAELELLEGELLWYERARLGVAADRRAGTYTAVMACRGRAFALLAPEERQARLEDYGAVLAALARDGSPVRRVCWVERTVPSDGDAMGDYLLSQMREELDLEHPAGELVSYLQLLGRAGAVAEEHELFFAVQIDAHAPGARRAVRRQGGGDLGAMTVLAEETGRLIELLDAAQIVVRGVLTRRGLAAVVRNAYDPWGRRQRERTLDPDEQPQGEGVAEHTAGPVAREEHWGTLAADGALHSTLWVAEWPRIDVRGLFLQPLLMSAPGVRSVAMVMELLGPARAIRRAERAATEASAERSLRDRVGQRTSQRQAQRESAAHVRERELAEGHAAVRFSAYVTVSVPRGAGHGELEALVSRVELEAKRCPLRLERLWGQQAEAFTYTLPLCRGLR